MAKYHYLYTLVFAVVLSVSGNAYAEEPAQGWYGGIALGFSRLEPDVSGTTYRVDKTQSSGGKLFVGYDLNDDWAVEAYYSDLGQAEMWPAGNIGYRDYGVSGMYYLYQEYPARQGKSLFVRAGVGSMDNDSDINISRKNDTHFMYGLGVTVPIAERWAARLDIDLYDKDSQLVALGLVWRFDNQTATASKPKPAPQPAPQPVLPADSDADGVVDAADQCPDTGIGTKVDDNGCELQQSTVLEGVSFLPYSADLTEDSKTVLDKVAESLKRHPELQVEVAGYTDISGSRTSNIKLSQQRADSVRDYLITQGIAAEMLSAKGYGPEAPIADNATAEGRAINRRVELHTLESDSEQESMPEPAPESAPENS